MLAGSCIAAQVSFKGFYSIANAADLTSQVTVSLVGGEMQSSCQGREDALTRAFKRLHLKRRGRRVRQLVQASVTLATGSEPLRTLPQQDRTLEQTECERAAGVLMGRAALTYNISATLDDPAQANVRCCDVCIMQPGTSNGSETKPG